MPNVRKKKAVDARKKPGKRTKGKSAGSKTTEAGRKKAAEAYEYRLQGFGFQEIADAMGISLSYAHDLTEKGRAACIREPALALIDMQIDRCNTLIQTFLAAAAKGDGNAAATTLSIMKQIDAYHGIGASTPGKGGKATVTLPGGAPGQETTKLEIEFV